MKELEAIRELARKWHDEAYASSRLTSTGVIEKVRQRLGARS